LSLAALFFVGRVWSLGGDGTLKLSGFGNAFALLALLRIIVNI